VMIDHMIYRDPQSSFCRIKARDLYKEM
jgi:hypothetical protein